LGWNPILPLCNECLAFLPKKHTNCDRLHPRSWSCALNMPSHLNAISFHNFLWCRWNSFSSALFVVDLNWEDGLNMLWRIKRPWCRTTKDWEIISIVLMWISNKPWWNSQFFTYKSQTFLPLQAQPFYSKRKKKMQGD
jgi:hypothetical protein